MSVKLFNQGERKITLDKLEFLPKQTGSFTPEAAKRLKRLYPDEVISLEDEIKRFDKAPDVVQASEEKPAKASGRKKAEAKVEGEDDFESSVGESESDAESEEDKKEEAAPKTGAAAKFFKQGK